MTGLYVLAGCQKDRWVASGVYGFLVRIKLILERGPVGIVFGQHPLLGGRPPLAVSFWEIPHGQPSVLVAHGGPED